MQCSLLELYHAHLENRRYKIAGKVVDIRFIHHDVHRLCQAYLTEEPADFTVETTLADIERAPLSPHLQYGARLRNHRLQGDEMTMFEKILARDGRLVYKSVGDSMLF